MGFKWAAKAQSTLLVICYLNGEPFLEQECSFSPEEVPDVQEFKRFVTIAKSRGMTFGDPVRTNLADGEWRTEWPVKHQGQEGLLVMVVLRSLSPVR